MALVTIPNTFTNGTPANATQVNANFTAITDQVNGNLDNNNVDPAAAIVESKILFSASGHDHSGGTNGKNIPEASVDFDAAAGHTHNNTDSNEVVAASATIRGAVLFKKYAASVGVTDAVPEVVSFPVAFTDIPVVSIWFDGSPDPSAKLSIKNVAASGFTIGLYDGTGAESNIGWAAIGI